VRKRAEQLDRLESKVDELLSRPNLLTIEGSPGGGGGYSESGPAAGGVGGARFLA
jgi:hypothetical protein